MEPATLFLECASLFVVCAPPPENEKDVHFSGTSFCSIFLCRSVPVQIRTFQTRSLLDWHQPF